MVLEVDFYKLVQEVGSEVDYREVTTITNN
jgi:hypothetical protein